MSRLGVIACTSAVAAALWFCSWGCGLTADFSGLQGGQAPHRGGYCGSRSPPPRFCDDFDEGPPSSSWVVTQQGGALNLDPSDFRSSPNSLVAVDAPLEAGTIFDCTLRKKLTLDRPPSTVTLWFSLQPVSVGSTASGLRLVIAAIDFFDATHTRYSIQFTLVTLDHGALSLVLEEQSDLLDGGVQYAAHELPGVPLAFGAWSDMLLSVTRSPVGQAATVLVGTVAHQVSLNKSGDPQELQIAMGSSFKSNSSIGWKNRYDNVTLDIAPP